MSRHFQVIVSHSFHTRHKKITEIKVDWNYKKYILIMIHYEPINQQK